MDSSRLNGNAFPNQDHLKQSDQYTDGGAGNSSARPQTQRAEPYIEECIDIMDIST